MKQKEKIENRIYLLDGLLQKYKNNSPPDRNQIDSIFDQIDNKIYKDKDLSFFMNL